MVCFGGQVGCRADVAPQSLLGIAGGVVTGGIAAVINEWADGGNLSVALVLGYAIGQAGVLAWLTR